MLFRRRASRPVSLALQGGGAHGAFTWGVLDLLLEDGRLHFEGISATSAGAMNAAILAHGLTVGGKDGARQALHDFWTALGGVMPFNTAVETPDGQGFSLAPGMKLMLQLSHFLSPEQLNPFDLNPLRDILKRQIDFAALRSNSPLKLFIAATHANSGRLRLFRETELQVEMLLASACLPTLHRAIELDGEPYWDGAYSANPAVFPLFYQCTARDIVMVLLSPLQHASTPSSADAIRSRGLELAFKATFLREMRMFAQLGDYLGQSWLPLGRLERRMVQTCFHAIELDDSVADMAADTKLAADMRLFEQLRDLGRARARDWLKAHFATLGQRSSISVQQMFA